MNVVSSSVNTQYSDGVTRRVTLATNNLTTADSGKIELGAARRFRSARPPTADPGKIRMGAAGRLPLERR